MHLSYSIYHTQGRRRHHKHRGSTATDVVVGEAGVGWWDHPSHERMYTYDQRIEETEKMELALPVSDFFK